MAQIETHTLVEATAAPGEGVYRGAVVCVSNLTQIRETLGQATALSVLSEFRACLGSFEHLQAGQVVYAGDDCFLVWLLERQERQLEELMVRASSRPAHVGGRDIALRVQAGWTELQCKEPRDLLSEEVGYVLFTAASLAVGSPSATHGERFVSDMEVASHVMAALHSDRVQCGWQGISGLYGGGAFLYWRGIAQPETPDLDAPYGHLQGFIPSLERLQLTRVLDRHIALRVLGQLISMPSLRLACRISPLSVQNDAYWGHLLSTLAAHPSAARRFTLEISGQVGLPSREAARAFCAAIRERGAHVALADFGCGPINLADVQACQPRTLLLDESFVRRCRSDPDEKVALRDMIRICAHLAEQIVVTGVDDEEAHSDALRAGARWISGGHVNPTPPFASKFWSGQSSFARSSLSPCVQRSHAHGAPARARPDDGGRGDWRGAALGTPREYVQ